MRFIEKNISGVFEIQPEVYEDSRGFFFESFNQKVFREKIGEEVSFCQDNHSFSKKGVLRGIHYQKKPFEQGKLVRVTDGRIFDVAIDLRKDSTSFGKWTSAILCSEEKNQLWIPEGFGHAFLTLSETAHVLYKATDFYNKDSEVSIRWDDPNIGISWPSEDIFDKNISDKDLDAMSLEIFLERKSNEL